MSRERGSASVLALVMVSVLVTVALVAGGLSGLLAGQRRAAAAADLAALAGAEAAGPGGGGGPGLGGGACEQADAIAAANQARLTSCAIDGPEVTVSVDVDVRLLAGVEVAVRGEARAGPSALGAHGP